MSCRLFSVAVAALLACLFASGSAFASVKCLCNNGTIDHAMSADYDDDDVEDSCNDACSDMGGGRVWNVDTDSDEDGDGNVTLHRGSDRVDHATPRR